MSPHKRVPGSRRVWIASALCFLSLVPTAQARGRKGADKSPPPESSPAPAPLPELDLPPIPPPEPPAPPAPAPAAAPVVAPVAPPAPTAQPDRKEERRFQLGLSLGGGWSREGVTGDAPSIFRVTGAIDWEATSHLHLNGLIGGAFSSSRLLTRGPDTTGAPLVLSEVAEQRLDWGVGISYGIAVAGGVLELQPGATLRGAVIRNVLAPVNLFGIAPGLRVRINISSAFAIVGDAAWAWNLLHAASANVLGEPLTLTTCELMLRYSIADDRHFVRVGYAGEILEQDHTARFAHLFGAGYSLAF